MWIYSKESINAEPQSQKNAESAEKNLKAYTERALKNGKTGFFLNRSEISPMLFIGAFRFFRVRFFSLSVVSPRAPRLRGGIFFGGQQCAL
jgi:hypothetical protein